MKKILMTVLALFCTLTTGCKTASTDNTSIDNVKYYTESVTNVNGRSIVLVFYEKR